MTSPDICISLFTLSSYKLLLLLLLFVVCCLFVVLFLFVFILFFVLFFVFVFCFCFFVLFFMVQLRTFPTNTMQPWLSSKALNQLVLKGKETNSGFFLKLKLPKNNNIYDATCTISYWAVLPRSLDSTLTGDITWRTLLWYSP